MGQFKIVAVDLDGTVLNGKKEISSENIRAFRACKEKGILVIPVTGRPLSGLYREYIDALGCRYSINTNGAVAVDLINKKVLIRESINNKIVEDILDVLEKFDCYYSLFYKGLGYLNEEKYQYELSRFEKTPMYRYIKETRRPVENQRKFMNNIDYCDNIYVTARTTEIRDRICQEIGKFKDIFFTCSDVDDVEIGGNCSKGKTLIELGNLLGVEKEEIIAIGDSGNDVAMLEMAGMGIAMGNASSVVKNSADFVTKSCEENGVAYAIKNFCL